jgi:acyl-homoserine lactone acylase PvdQ
MSVYVYQTFELKQGKFKEAIENLQEMKKFRSENYEHKVEILTPITGNDHTYSLLSIYDGLAELELQNKKMFADEEYQKLIESFFLENIEQGSMQTSMYRSMSE